MAKEFAKKFYNSSAWKKCRAAYIQSVNGLCERCLKNNALVTGYILHHKTELTAKNINDPYVTLNWDNLEYVCKKCHDKEHGVGAAESPLREGLMFDKRGRLKEVAPPNFQGGVRKQKTEGQQISN